MLAHAWKIEPFWLCYQSNFSAMTFMLNIQHAITMGGISVIMKMF